MISRESRTEPATESIQIVTFSIGDTEYGLDITCITEVIRPLKLTALPRMPKFVEGVVNLRGVIIPIMDLRKRFFPDEVPEDGRSTRMMITRGAVTGSESAEKVLLGLTVDSVNDVLEMPRQEIEPTPEAAKGEQVDFIAGMGKVGDRLVVLLDITRILNHEERTALAEAEHAGH